MEVLLNPPGKRMYKKRAAILRKRAFQAGCRGFESRLPLFPLNRLSASASHASLRQPSDDSNSKRQFCFFANGVHQHPASHIGTHPAFARFRPPAPSMANACPEKGGEQGDILSPKRVFLHRPSACFLTRPLVALFALEKRKENVPDA